MSKGMATGRHSCCKPVTLKRIQRPGPTAALRQVTWGQAANSRKSCAQHFLMPRRIDTIPRWSHAELT